MKKINSIGYGHRILGIALLFLVALPLCFYLLFVLIQVAIIKILIYVSLGVGILISVCFVGLLAIEFRQDRDIDHQYTTMLCKTKMRTGSGMYECQACGNRQVGEADSECKVCGTIFYQEEGDGRDNRE